MREPDTAGPKPSVIVLGAGVSGLSVALALLKHGQRVTLLERGEVGAESSWAGGGILSPLLPWDYPDALAGLALRSMAPTPTGSRLSKRRAGATPNTGAAGCRCSASPSPTARSPGAPHTA